jgi:hypothetical protein
MPSVDQWKEKLNRILKSSQGRDLAEVISDIRDLGAAMGQNAGEALLDANPEFLEYRPALQRAFYDYVIKNEISQTRQILQQDWNGSASFTEVSPDFLVDEAGFHLANSLSRLIFNRSIDMYDHLDFRGCSRMVLVGCGWMPATLFHVHDKTDVPELVGLDIVPDAIATSNELAKHLGYVRVRTELQDARSYDYSQSQIVYIVGMISEMKSTILSRIADTAPDNVQVLVNEPYSLAQLWEEPAEPSLDPRFEVIGKGKDWYAHRTVVTGRGLGRPALGHDMYLRRRPNPISGKGRLG